MTIRKTVFAAMASALLLAASPVSALQEKMQVEEQFIGCCITSKGDWCCFIGLPTCQCRVGHASAAMTPLPDGKYSGDSLREAMQKMMDALPDDGT